MTIQLPSIGKPFTPIAVPKFKVPKLSVPSVSVPTVGSLSLSLKVKAPAIALPTIGKPFIPKLPTLKLPKITTPSISLGVSTSLPSVSLPSVGLGSLSLSLKKPAITLPSFQVGISTPFIPNLKIPRIAIPAFRAPTLTICCKSPIPTFNSLYQSVTTSFPPGGVSIPPLPGVPDPVYPGVGSINQEILAIIQNLQTFQFYTTLTSFLLPLIEFLGLALDDILPKIPGTNLTLVDLLALDATAVYDALKALPLSFIQTLPGVPSPLSYAIDAPSVSISIAVQGILNGYMTLVINVIAGLINDAVNVIDAIGLPGLPSIPTIPTLSDLQALLIPPSLPIPDVTALLNRLNLNELMALIPIPGFPSLPAFSLPLVFSTNIPEFDLMNALNILYASLVEYPMTIIYNFIQEFLQKFINFNFPLICITL